MIPDVLEINDPPIIVINKKYKLYFQDIKDSLLSRGYTETEKTKYTIGWIVLIFFAVALFQ